MDALLPFSIPVSGLREGIHRFSFQVEEAFFQAFEGSILRDAEVEVLLELDKRPSLMLLGFQLRGWVETECDRCLGYFHLPVDEHYEVSVKYAEEASDQAEVVYIRRDEPSLSVAKLIYDFLHLSLPMYKTHDLIGQTCDPDMVAFLKREKTPQKQETKTSSESVWDILKDLDF